MVNLLGYEYAQNDYLPKRQLASPSRFTSIGTARLNHALVESWGTSLLDTRTNLRQVHTPWRWQSHRANH